LKFATIGRWISFPAALNHDSVPLLLSPDIDGHEGDPRVIRSQDRGCKYFVVGAFQLRHFSKFGRRLRTGNGAFRFPGQNISRDIERAFKLPDVAGHAIDHRSDVFFLLRLDTKTEGKCSAF
jgi:hypothetical protein